MHLRDSWIFLWQGFSKDFRVAPILSRDFSSFLLRNLIHWIHQIFVNFLFNPRTNKTRFLFNSMIFSFEKIPLPFFPNKRDYLRAVSLYYSFDSVHPEFRTWIYIGNMSNTRLTLLWENINFFFFHHVSRLYAVRYGFLHARGRRRKRVSRVSWFWNTWCLNRRGL